MGQRCDHSDCRVCQFCQQLICALVLQQHSLCCRDAAAARQAVLHTSCLWHVGMLISIFGQQVLLQCIKHTQQGLQ